MLDSNIKFSGEKKIIRCAKKQEKIFFHAKKKKSTETGEKGHMADRIDKEFKKPVLKMLRKLKEDTEKVKIMMYEQNGTMNKDKI